MWQAFFERCSDVTGHTYPHSAGYRGDVGTRSPYQSDVTGNRPVTDWSHPIDRGQLGAPHVRPYRINAVRDSWGASYLWLFSLGPPLALSPCHAAAGQGPQGEAAEEPERAKPHPEAPPPRRFRDSRGVSGAILQYHVAGREGNSPLLHIPPGPYLRQM